MTENRLIGARLCHCGDHAFAYLTRGYVTLVSPEDAALLATKWWASVRDRTVYAMRTEDGRNLRLHRLIGGDTAPIYDHKNGNGLDNRRGNLRPATRSQNQGNRRSQRNAGSAYLGVHFDKKMGKWRAQARGVHIGWFVTELEAAVAYNDQAPAFHGEFARLNDLRNAKDAASP